MMCLTVVVTNAVLAGRSDAGEIAQQVSLVVQGRGRRRVERDVQLLCSKADMYEHALRF